MYGMYEPQILMRVSVEVQPLLNVPKHLARGRPHVNEDRVHAHPAHGLKTDPERVLPPRWRHWIGTTVRPPIFTVIMKECVKVVDDVQPNE